MIRGGTEFWLELRQRFDQHVTDDGQASRADFVEGIRGRVPEVFVLRIFQIDDVRSGHAAVKERQMVVFDGSRIGDKNLLIAELCRGRPDQICQPGSRVRFLRLICRLRPPTMSTSTKPSRARRSPERAMRAASSRLP